MKGSSNLDKLVWQESNLLRLEFHSSALPLSYKPMIALDIGFQHDLFSEDYLFLSLSTLSPV
mgnify:CR=1 FL=1